MKLEKEYPPNMSRELPSGEGLWPRYNTHMKDLTRRGVAPAFSLFLLLCMSPCGDLSIVFAADIIPAPSPEPKKRESNPAPPAQGRPSIDPGIAVPPPTEPHPESVVTPPTIDPKMSIHPEDSPTSKQPSFPTPPSPQSPGAPPPK